MELRIDCNTCSTQPFQGLGVCNGVKVMAFDENFTLRSRRQDECRERHAMVTVGPDHLVWPSEYLPTAHVKTVPCRFGREAKLGQERHRPRQAIGLFVGCMRCTRDEAATAHRHQGSEWRDEVIRITQIDFGVLGRKRTRKDVALDGDSKGLGTGNEHLVPKAFGVMGQCFNFNAATEGSRR